MTGFLSQVTTGPTPDGQRMVIAGAEGIGKTTLACSAPNVLLVPLEQGYSTIPVAKTPMITKLDDVWGLMDEIETGIKTNRIAKGSTIVFDSATALERIIHLDILANDVVGQRKYGKTHTMETALEGYGKAYGKANMEFDRFTGRLDEWAKHGKINIVVTCHVFARKVMDPAHGEYHSWDLLLHSPKDDKNYGKRERITQWADFIGFLHEPMFVQKGEEGDKLRRGIGGNQGRVLAVSRTPAWTAKNRYGLNGVLPIPKDEKKVVDPNSWNVLAHAIYESCGIDVWNRAQ